MSLTNTVREPKSKQNRIDEVVSQHSKLYNEIHKGIVEGFRETYDQLPEESVLKQILPTNPADYSALATSFTCLMIGGGSGA